MKLIVTSATRFFITPDRNLWTGNQQDRYYFWQRYLDVFDGVRILGRALPASRPPEGWKRATGPAVNALPLPHYHGPGQFLIRYPALVKAIRAAARTQDAVILRMPNIIGTVFQGCSPIYRPIGVEVVADPYDIFAPGAVRHPLRPMFRHIFPRLLRWQCTRACGAAYVTEGSLQRRYPTAKDTFATHYSSIIIPESNFVSVSRVFKDFLNIKANLIAVGSLEHFQKGPDTLINALSILKQKGIDYNLTWVGGGKHLNELEERATTAGLGEQIHFVGQVSTWEKIKVYLDGADIFVLPSRQEGLPRAVIEAMARALPCICSTIGGIPELLPPEDMVPANDAQALADKLLEVASNPKRMTTMSARNLEKSREYEAEVLRLRRNVFYCYIRAKTEKWIQISKALNIH